MGPIFIRKISEKAARNLRRALVLVDSRHGLKDTDRDIMDADGRLGGETTRSS